MDDVDLQYRLLRDGHGLAVSTVVSEHIKSQSLREFVYRMYMGEDLTFRAMDPSHIALVDLHWPKNAFERY
jgi:hypothetical protein